MNPLCSPGCRYPLRKGSIAALHAHGVYFGRKPAPKTDDRTHSFGLPRHFGCPYWKRGPARREGTALRRRHARKGIVLDSKEKKSTCPAGWNLPRSDGSRTSNVKLKCPFENLLTHCIQGFSAFSTFLAAFACLDHGCCLSLAVHRLFTYLAMGPGHIF